MDVFGVLLQPVILIPGVGLLILSTAARFGQLEGPARGPGGPDPDGLLRRARRFHIALIALYVAVLVLAISSIGGGLIFLLDRPPHGFVTATVCLAVLAVLVAVATLLTECRLAMRMLGEEFRPRPAAKEG